MLAQKTKQIEGDTFTVTQLSTDEGIPCLVRLTKLLGKGFEGGSVQSAVANIAAQLSVEDVQFFTRTFSKWTVVSTGDGKTLSLSNKDHFELAFAGRYENLVQWLAFCIEVNFSSFFGKMVGMLTAKAQEATAVLASSSS